MEVIEDKWMPHPYPDPIDNGQWEDDGGYVAKPDYQAWLMEFPDMGAPYWMNTTVTRQQLIVHPLTMAELNHEIKNWKKYDL